MISPFSFGPDLVPGGLVDDQEIPLLFKKERVDLDRVIELVGQMRTTILRSSMCMCVLSANKTRRNHFGCMCTSCGIPHRMRMFLKSRKGACQSRSCSPSSSRFNFVSSSFTHGQF